MPAFVLILAVGLLALGLYCYQLLDIEAYPNPVAPMIEIITQPTGWSAEEVERYVTIPLENGLNGMIDLDHIRSQSLFGLSDVKCYFTWSADYHTAQQRVLNRLGFVSLPPGATPQLSPWSAIGEIYRYVVRGQGYSLADLKTAQDWILERQFRQVPGVIDVVGFGGETKEYHVEVDPYRLKGHGLTLSQLVTALGTSNQNVGGQRLTIGEQSYDVRGIGIIRSLNDIRDVVLSAQKGTPIRVRDVAEVTVGHAPRLGIVGKDLDPDVVQGTVLMRYGGDSLKTLDAVHQRVDEITRFHVLPPGMTIEPYYDRANLVRLTTHTVLENLLIGMVLVAVVLWMFLGHGKRRAHHRAQHPAGADGGVHRDGLERDARQPHLAGGGRLRDRRRLHGHRDGERLSAHGRARQAQRHRADPAGGRRGRAADVLLDAGHRRRLHPALHAVGRVGGDLLADGAHLRLRHRRRDRPVADADAGAGRARPQDRHARRPRARQLADAGAQEVLPAAV